MTKLFGNQKWNNKDNNNNNNNNNNNKWINENKPLILFFNKEVNISEKGKSLSLSIRVCTNIYPLFELNDFVFSR